MSDILPSATTPSPKYIVPALGGLYEMLRPLSYPILRVACGALLIPHGIAKLFGGAAKGTAFFMAMTLGGHGKAGAGPFAESWLPIAYYLGTLELVGGAMLVVGLLTRVIAAQVIGFMFVAATMVHSGFGYFWNTAGWEMPLMWLLLAIVVLIRGGGAYSLDNRLGKEF